MYKLNYYNRITEGLSNKEQYYDYLSTGEVFRRRKDALHYLFGTVQDEYKAMGYTTEIKVGSLYCYKSDKTALGDRRIIEMLIKVEK